MLRTTKLSISKAVQAIALVAALRSQPKERDPRGRPFAFLEFSD